ncbi:MAG: hypothetical protein NC489_24520 [Ruminococcus flavefaciens]|nr:hypothetical protein [Ruminococcus flavefaciens]
MGEIIVLEKYKHRCKKSDRVTQSDKIPNNTENFNAFIEYMSSEATKIADNCDSELLDKKEKDRRKAFEEKYEDVLSTAPSSVADKIPYYANVMLDLLPAIFHSQTEEDKFNIYMDFSEFYLCELDEALCEYRSANEKYEKKYPFRFPRLDASDLENALRDCLTQLISLFPTKNNSDKTQVMWQACRLFELYHNIDDVLFSEH